MTSEAYIAVWLKATRRRLVLELPANAGLTEAQPCRNCHPVHAGTDEVDVPKRQVQGLKPLKIASTIELLYISA